MVNYELYMSLEQCPNLKKKHLTEREKEIKAYIYKQRFYSSLDIIFTFPTPSLKKP